MSPGEIPSGSLYREGQAMMAALAEDLLTLPGVELRILRDARLTPWNSSRAQVRLVADQQEHEIAFDDGVSVSDGVLVIAPEFQGCLFERAKRVIDLKGKLLSPDPSFIALTSDKVKTIDRLREAGVNVPRTYPVIWNETGLLKACQNTALTGALVLKPRDGAGSVGLRHFHHGLTNQDVADLLADPELQAWSWCVQEFCEGRAASVAAIGDGESWSMMPPCWQFLEPASWTYVGGAVISAAELAERAWELGERTLETLPRSRGFVGIDLVLGSDPLGREDFVLEVNPRLTTSYVGLRRAIGANLAEVMLELDTKPRPSRFPRRSGEIQFSADGDCRCV